MSTEEYSFTVLFELAEEGGYVVTCPAVPGLVTEGDSLEEARKMAGDAIRAYLSTEGRSSDPAHSRQEPPPRDHSIT